jgi:hypothetical protein
MLFWWSIFCSVLGQSKGMINIFPVYLGSTVAGPLGILFMIEKRPSGSAPGNELSPVMAGNGRQEEPTAQP